MTKVNGYPGRKYRQVCRHRFPTLRLERRALFEHITLVVKRLPNQSAREGRSLKEISIQTVKVYIFKISYYFALFGVAKV